MKKISLLVCAVFASLTLFAGVIVSPKKQVGKLSAAEGRQLVTKQQMATEHNAASINAQSVRKAVAEDDTTTMSALYFIPNQFVTGAAEGNMFWDYGPHIVTPFLDSVNYYSGLNVPALAPVWTLDGAEYAKGVNEIMVEAGEYDAVFSLPTLGYDPDTLRVSANKIYQFTPYQFGSLWYQGAAAKNSLWMGLAGIYPVTQCGRYSNYPHPLAPTYIHQGFGWIWVTGVDDEYSYGTKVTNHLYDVIDTIKISPITGNDTLYYDTIPSTVLFDSIVTVVNNPDVMYIEDISLGIWCQNDDYFPDAENDHLTITLLPITETGIDWNNPIATATAGLQDTLDGWGWLDGIMFKFYAEDPTTHAKKQVPVIVDGPFAVLYSGLSQGTTDVGFITDFDGRFPDAPSAKYRTYFVDYSQGSRRLINYWQGANNIMLTFDAMWPSIQGLPEEIAVPLAGGEKTFTIPTNVESNDMDLDYDDWMDIELEDVTEEYQGEEYFAAQVKVTLTIDEAEVGRDGLIEIDALGKVYKVKVVQGGGSTGIQSVKKVNDGKLYNVLGLEVDENYKGVVIRNGEKFLQ